MNQSIRVVHLTPALFGEEGVFGGAERYSFELARYMARETPTTLVCFGDEPRSFTTDDGLSVRVLGPAWKVRGQPLNRLHRGLLGVLCEADVIHCHQPHMLASELSALYGRLRGKRVFASDLGGGGWGFSSYMRTTKWFHGHLHISDYSRRAAGHEGNGKAHVIFGGVDTQMFSPDPSIAREPLVVFVGRLLPHKGVNDLVEALPVGLTLELIGRPYHDEFEQELRRLASGKRVTFRTNCDDQDIVNAYRRAQCVVLPSVYRDCYANETKIPELLGQTLIEAMACGTSVVCTDVASMPEVVTDGETGFVVPPNCPRELGEKLVWFRDHPAEAAQFGGAARERVLNDFTWPMVVAKCLSAYRGCQKRSPDDEHLKRPSEVHA